MPDCRLAVLLLLLVYVAGTSSLFYRTTSDQPYRCLPDITLGQLANVSVTMADMTRFYQHCLPQILIPRIPDTPSHALVRQFIENEMRSLGWTVELDQFEASTPFNTKTFTNIIATLKPSATKRVVFACHYDSKYLQGSPNFVAATDSAVPCAILLDTAWKLRDSLLLQDTTPQFIFFDGEEAFSRWTADDSLYGSRHLAARWQTEFDPNDELAANNLENIEFFVLLDLIGGPDLKFTDFYQNTSRHFYKLYHTEYCLQTSRVIPSQTNRPMFDLWSSSRTVVEDDHIPFIQKGVPVLHLISIPFPRVWHRPQDDLQHLDTPTIDRFTTIFRTFFFRLFN